MTDSGVEGGMILRLFTAQVKEGRVEELLAKFATTSADVVQHEPGNTGYFYGRGVAQDDGTVIFASLWQDLDAVKQRFGDDWQVSYLPEGYDEMIKEHAIKHIQLGKNWPMRVEN